MVQFESCESLRTMVMRDCVDLSGDFEIEVLNWNGETVVPGYCIDTVISGNVVRLKKSTVSEIVA
jgi:hypothetical protein